MRQKVMTIGVAACVLALVAGLSFAQQGQRGGDQRGGDRRGGDPRAAGGDQRGPGGFDPAQMRQRMAEQMKERLGADDQAWKVLEPRIEKVTRLRMQTMSMDRGGMMGMFGGMRGRGPEGGPQGGPQGDRRGPFGQAEQPALDKAMAQLRTTLENSSASPEEIKKALTAVRQERIKAQQELATAREDLKKLCTPRQEAVLVVMGLLE